MVLLRLMHIMDIIIATRVWNAAYKSVIVSVYDRINPSVQRKRLINAARLIKSSWKHFRCVTGSFLAIKWDLIFVLKIIRYKHDFVHAKLPLN